MTTRTELLSSDKIAETIMSASEDRTVSGENKEEAEKRKKMTLNKLCLLRSITPQYNNET